MRDLVGSGSYHWGYPIDTQTIHPVRYAMMKRRTTRSDLQYRIEQNARAMALRLMIWVQIP